MKKFIGLFVLILAGCLTSSNAPPILWAGTSNNISTYPITVDGTGQYNLTDTNGVITVSAPSTNTGDAGRGYFTLNGSVSVDQEVCMQWGTSSWNGNQFGLVLRAGPNQALIMTDNVYPNGAATQFNFYGFENGVATVWTTHNFSSVLGLTIPIPLNVCSQVVGNVWSVKVWLVNGQEPNWNDPSVFNYTIPDGWNIAGNVGGYVAHLQPGNSMTFNSMEQM